mmetsp:Transcript_16006/g.34644  ORF Transcript_16006/g.34644 Transcript_16006/m.34644 type:complete len:200 (+) Transcript_16006:92-691(+)
MVAFTTAYFSCARVYSSGVDVSFHGVLFLPSLLRRHAGLALRRAQHPSWNDQFRCASHGVSTLPTRWHNLRPLPSLARAVLARCLLSPSLQHDFARARPLSPAFTHRHTCRIECIAWSWVLSRASYAALVHRSTKRGQFGSDHAFDIQERGKPWACGCSRHGWVHCRQYTRIHSSTLLPCVPMRAGCACVTRSGHCDGG